MPGKPRRSSRPRIAYQRIDEACTQMLKITYYPDTYERTRDIVPIEEVPVGQRCRPGTAFVPQGADFTVLTSDLVSAFVKNNPVQAHELPNVIQTVHGTLRSLAVPSPEAGIDRQPRTPSQIRKSITADHLISFIDGKAYRSLNRHLRAHDLDAEGYRARYDLPADYPMVAANYSARRAELARTMGFSRRRTRGP